MLKRLKFPWIYVIELVLWLPLVTGFIATIAFVASQPITDLKLAGKSLPKTWEAAVPNHGKSLEGYLINSHPFAFAAALVLFLASAVSLYHVHKAQLWQLKNAPGLATAHKLAQAGVFAILAALGYVVLTQLLVGVSPS